MKHWPAYLLARVAVASLEYAPLPVARHIARWWIRGFDFAIPKLRRVAMSNLSFALPERDARQVVDGVFHALARVLLALARFPHLHAGTVSDWIRCEGLEHYTEAKRRGRGVLVATAHLGNWELSAFAHALMTEPMHVVVRPLDNPLLDGFVERRRQMSGNRVIAKRDGARAIMKALARNEAVGILIDQNVTPEEGVFVPFFGRLASAGTAFVRIAHRTGAAVVPGYAVWSEAEQRHVLHFERIVEMTGDIAADTVRVHAVLESAIRRYPDQWLWIHRRWKTRPKEEL